MIFKTFLLEDGRKRSLIRSIVKDIIFVYKNEDEGEFYLPNYIDEENDFYHVPGGFGIDLAVELSIEVDDSVGTYQVDANYFRNEEIIQVIIKYNLNEKNKIIYDLIGNLNEIVAHEIRHVSQKNNKTFDLDVPEEEDPFKYYTQEHELDAQRFGFKRISKLTRTPIEDVVKKWFDTHKDIHRLNDEQIKVVISKILNN